MAKKGKGLTGPMYSSGTSQQDSKDNAGSVAGPKGGKGTPDPLSYTRK